MESGQWLALGFIGLVAVGVALVGRPKAGEPQLATIQRQNKAFSWGPTILFGGLIWSCAIYVMVRDGWEPLYMVGVTVIWFLIAPLIFGIGD